MDGWGVIVSFKATVRHLQDVAVVDLAGRLTLGEAATLLHNTIESLIGSGEKKIVLNLKEVTYLDSAGLGELLGAHNAAAASGGQIRIIHAQPKIQEHMRVMRLTNVLADYGDEELAAKSFAAVPSKA